MRLILLASFMFVTRCYAQVEYKVKIANDTVFNNNKAEFTCKEVSKGNLKMYSLRSLDSVALALITFTERDTNLVCTARFPAQKLRYDVLYPRIDISVLMESYLRNKVIVNGRVDTTGLKNYCVERNIPLNKIEPRRIGKPVMNDSALAANAKADYESQIPFTIYNESGKSVRVVIGTKGNNRTVAIPSGGNLNQRARLNDDVCLLEGDKKITCTQITKSVKTLYIKDNKISENQTD